MNPSHKTRNIFMTSLVASLILTVCPMSPDLALWMPHWALLFVMSWVIYCPKQFGLLGALFVGLLADVLLGGIWGLNALTFVIIAFLSYQLRLRFRYYHVWQQTILIGLFTFTHLLILYWVHHLVGQQPLSSHYWYSTFSTMACWPFIFVAARKWLFSSMQSA